SAVPVVVGQRGRFPVEEPVQRTEDRGLAGVVGSDEGGQVFEVDRDVLDASEVLDTSVFDVHWFPTSWRVDHQRTLPAASLRKLTIETITWLKTNVVTRWCC